MLKLGIQNPNRNLLIGCRIRFFSLSPPSTVLAVSLQLRRACESRGVCVALPHRAWRAIPAWPAGYEGTLPPVKIYCFKF